MTEYFIDYKGEALYCSEKVFDAYNDACYKAKQEGIELGKKGQREEDDNLIAAITQLMTWCNPADSTDIDADKFSKDWIKVDRLIEKRNSQGD